MNNYLMFGLMITTSILVMFSLSYLNIYQLDHAFFSQTRMFMALIMGAGMAAIMLGYMHKMYTNKRVNIGIFVGSLALFLLALFLVRSQVTVGDVSYMKAMIPHHSIAILTSNKARITDPRVRKLADKIIDAQKREIEEMKELIRHIETNK